MTSNSSMMYIGSLTVDGIHWFKFQINATFNTDAYDYKNIVQTDTQIIFINWGWVTNAQLIVLNISSRTITHVLSLAKLLGGWIGYTQNTILAKNNILYFHFHSGDYTSLISRVEGLVSIAQMSISNLDHNKSSNLPPNSNLSSIFFNVS